MLDLSPTKLIIIFVVVVVLLGPKRLPQVARQLGAGWQKVRVLHHQIDTELRQTMPDLPSSQDIVRFARSPVSLLNRLADAAPTAVPPVEDPGAPQPATAEQHGAGGGAPWPQDAQDRAQISLDTGLSSLDTNDPHLN